MTDQELFELIKKAVRDKKKIPHHSDTQTFAERYCDQQLAKKKLNHCHSHVKMDSLMKNFTQLETYFDLPELLESIKMMKIQKQSKNPKQNKVISLFKQNETQLQNGWSKHLNDMKNLRFSVQNGIIKTLMSELEKNSSWNSQILQNNSIYNLNIICDHLDDAQENKQKNSPLFQQLKIFKQNEEKFIHREAETVTTNQINFNFQEKTQYTHFLHKVSSYLLIALEIEHRSKWRHMKRRSTNLKKSLPNFIILNKQVRPKIWNERISQQSNNSTSTQRASNNKKHTNYEQNGKRYQKMNPQFPSLPSRFFQQTQYKLKEKDTVNNDFHKTDSTSKPIMQSNMEIRQNFTFRRRSVKQKIINRLNKFIGDIEEQNHCNKKQNKYYNDQINKLQSQFRMLHGRYKRQTLAGEKDIQNLKKLASEFQVKTPSRKELKEEKDKIIFSHLANEVKPYNTNF